MRHLLLLLAFLLLAGRLQAQQPQEKKKIPDFTAKVTAVKAGFGSYDPNDFNGQYKLGLWTVVYVDVLAGQKGIQKKEGVNYIEVETADSEGVGTIYKIDVGDIDPLKSDTFVTYAKSGSATGSGEVKVTLHIGSETFSGPEQRGVAAQPHVNNHHFLALGSKLAVLKDAVNRFNPRGVNPDWDDFNAGLRLISFESNVDRLPDLWFGYQGVDLAFLSTDKKEFLSQLTNDKSDRLKALSQWVRQGGRLVISVHPEQQALLNAFLRAPAWQPPVPVVPPANPGDAKQNRFDRLEAIDQWTVGPEVKQFRAAKGIAIARLDPGAVPVGAWDVFVKTDDGRPLITRMPYGLGSITMVAFSLDSGAFTEWGSRADFLKTLILKVGTRVNPNVREDMQGDASADLTSSLQRMLEIVDVDVIPFGYVALFIVLYILVVGPIDYFVLKYVFNKLEWTWITFPTVVILVSVAAYWTAYALKGNELKLNRVDVVDFDLRTDLDGDLKTRRAYATGQSYLMLFSPRIQNYTVGLEANDAFWGAEQGEKPPSADMVTWLGRADLNGPGGIKQAGSQGFFRRPYRYAPDARGLENVSIPVWTTRSFTASWASALTRIPFEANLVFHTKERAGQDIKISGTLKSKLPVDLEDVYFLYGDRCYPLPGGLPGTKSAQGPDEKPAEANAISLVWTEGVDFSKFLADQGKGSRVFGTQSSRGIYNPTSLVKEAMFFEKSDHANKNRNHAIRPLDLSWRLKSAELRHKDQSSRDQIREVIVYGRVRFQTGKAEALTQAGISPTNLWLGALPGQTDRNGKYIARPDLSGTMAQDTYVRILLPVRAAD